MPDSNAAESAIEKLIGEYQKLADIEKDEGPKRQATQQKVDDLVKDLADLGKFDKSKVSEEMVSAFLALQQSLIMTRSPEAQMKLANFSDDFFNDFADYLEAIQTDVVKRSKIELLTKEFITALRPPAMQVNKAIYGVALDKPEKGFGEWTICFVAVQMDENYKVKLAEELEFDLEVTLEVSPSKSLADTFNVPGKRYSAGEKFEPFTITHETEEDDRSSILNVRGHVYQSGQRIGEIACPPVALFNNQVDMDMLMRMMNGPGQGPNGLN